MLNTCWKDLEELSLVCRGTVEYWANIAVPREAVDIWRGNIRRRPKELPLTFVNDDFGRSQKLSQHLGAYNICVPTPSAKLDSFVAISQKLAISSPAI